MAFESLSDKLQGVFKKLKSKGKLSESDVKEALREVKLALLEADVNFKVVKKFIKKIQERAIGHDVLGSLTPGQQVVKIVHEELIEIIGSSQSSLTFANNAITVFVMVGLQGAGKTTTCAKLAGKLKKQGKRPLLVACDVYRPAAIKQLKVVGDSLDIPVFAMGSDHSPVDISKAAIEHAKKNGNDIVIIDTAGRLHVDESMMDELLHIKEAVNPQEILLVVDAMTGQDAVNVAENFNNIIGIDGIILTKLDGDARGGAALSVREVTGKPIKYIGMGEKLDDLEPFYPDRMASRILGMGDVLTLIEKAQSAIDEESVAKLGNKIKNSDFDFEDFLEQMQQVKKMGPLNDLIGMIPGVGQQLGNVEIDESEIGKIEALILSMTKQERRDPAILNASRKRRIAKGSGQTIQNINKLVKQFEQSKKMMKQFSGMMKTNGKKGKLKLPFM